MPEPRFLWIEEPIVCIQNAFMHALFSHWDIVPKVTMRLNDGKVW